VKDYCLHCGGAARARCARCRVARYCGAECQRLHFPCHRAHCPALPSLATAPPPPPPLTPLHRACEAGHAPALRALLAAGAAFPDPLDGAAQAVRRAAAAARARAAAAAAAADAPRDDGGDGGSDSDDDGAPRRGPAAAAAAFADKDDDDDDVGGWLHPVHCAIRCGHGGLVRELLAVHGVPLALAQPASGDTLLHAAAKCGHAAVLRVVLAAVAAAPAPAAALLLEAVNDAGCTPLVDAIAARQPAAALALLAAGADARARAPPLLAADFPDALALAVGGGSAPLVAALLAAGADAGARNAHGETPLHAASSMGSPGCVAALLAAGADAGALTPGACESPLHLLAQRDEDGASQDAASGGAAHDAADRCAVARLLLGAGAAVNARTALGGHTPVWLAAFHGSPLLACWLVRHGGADPTLLDAGRNPALVPADAFAAPALNAARAAYAPSPAAFAAACGALVGGLRAAWAEAAAGAAAGAAGAAGTPVAAAPPPSAMQTTAVS
jgi:ankyrin repeat protein